VELFFFDERKERKGEDGKDEVAGWDSGW